MISFFQFQTAAKHIGVLKGAVDNKNGPDSKNAAEEFLPIVLQTLGLPDPREIQKKLDDRNTRLNDIRAKATL